MISEQPILLTSLETRNGVLISDGYGVDIRVDRSRLVVRDGICDDRREARFARATSGLKRLVVLGHSGMITLEAMRWLNDIGAAFVQIDADSRVIAASGPSCLDDARLRRAQALALTHPVGLEITKWICREKINGQESVLTVMGAKEDSREAVRLGTEAVKRAGSLDAVLIAEGIAAAAYWAAWTDIPVAFARRDAERVPRNWLTFGQRGSPLTGSPRLAANPANALLNYLYALLEAEARIACLAVGLDPGMGILHADQRGRDSLALDIMEAVRPNVDAFVLELLRRRVFRASDFFETRQGVCRMLPPLTHSLAETAPTWAKYVAPVAERVARLLATAPGARIRRITTPLTQSNRSAGRDGFRHKAKSSATVRAALPPAACRMCGVILDATNRSYCDDCLPERRRNHVAESFQKAGPAALRRLIAEGRDPSHGGRAGKRRGTSIAKRNRESAEWDRSHPGRPDPEQFRRDILPELEGVPLQKIRDATGLSLYYCSLIRRGLYVPNARHWDKFAQLVDAKHREHGELNAGHYGTPKSEAHKRGVRH